MSRIHSLAMSRIRSLAIASVAALVAGVVALPATSVRADEAAATRMIFHDPETPVSGNPRGDVTIVAFLDYNCPYCKKSAPELERLVREDGNIRVVYKDWPILTPASVHGARLALAAKRQGKYDLAHEALMGIPGRRNSEETMSGAIEAAGIDMGRLEKDMTRDKEKIDQLLQRNLAQADMIGLRGTPAYLIGPFKVESSLDHAAFKAAVADARARQAKK